MRTCISRPPPDRPARSTPATDASHPHPEVSQMFRPRKQAVGIALVAILALVLAACSATGGRRAAEAAANAGTSVAAGHANTPHYTIAMITHAAPGDTFWDIIRAGASAAAAKDNITLKYSNNDDPTQQAQLITDAINSQRQRHRGHRPRPRGTVPDHPEGQGGRASRWSCSTRATPTGSSAAGWSTSARTRPSRASRRASAWLRRARRTCSASCRPRARLSSRPGARA